MLARDTCITIYIIYWYMIQCKYHTIVVCDTTDTKLKRIFAIPTSIKDLSCESGSVQVRAQCWRSSCWLLIACSELFSYKELDSFFTQQSLKPTMLWTWWDDNWEALMLDTNTQVWPFCWAFERVWQIEFWEVFVLAEWFGALPNPPLLIRHDSNLQHCPSPTSVLQCIWYWYQKVSYNAWSCYTQPIFFFASQRNVHGNSISHSHICLPVFYLYSPCCVGQNTPKVCLGICTAQTKLQLTVISTCTLPWKTVKDC